jgi:putative addiction module killer protein
VIEVREYVPEGRTASLFAEWFLGLDTRARQLVDDAVARMRLGNLGDCKRVGDGVVERRIDSGPGYRIYFGRDGDKLILLLAGSTKRRQQDLHGSGSMARVQAAQAEGETDMALTRDFRDTVMAAAQKDPAYRRNLLTRGFALSHSADEEDRNVGKSLLRDYINATLGFQALAKELDKKPESLMRMLSTSGNPRLSNFAELVECLFEHEGIALLDEE